ncbi:hypothetical protein Poly30_15160 [Planctomycetes bacterium Poly30]|uniref:Aerotolerance regulator N-terminal domain-containing protein n=1 Tax=Saltatorellus ferox TaxID=2528018 RepID=A0A518EPJ7_9BACT|nr:hypothetical protein Poly30_15160 [Planctomycetes bacterium Poly30]
MFANPLGLLGLASLAAILGLHLYRRRRRPLVVSAVFLWDEVTNEAQGGRARQPLRRSLSLLAELFGALFLTLALAGPRWFGAETARHYVAVIDSSASLTARSAIDGTTARERAREAVTRSLREMPSDSRATLVLTGPEPIVLAGPFAFRDEALAELAKPWPIFGDHDPTAGLLLGAELAAGGAIDHVTDHVSKASATASATERIRWIAVGEPASNVGITAALRARTTDGDDEIRVVVRNASDRAATLRLTLAPADEPGTAVAEEALVLEPDETRGWTYRVRSTARVMVARIDPVGGPDGASLGAALDGFPIDDVAYLGPPPQKTLRLASRLEAGPSQGLGLGAAGSAERWAEIVIDATAVGSDESPHLVISADAIPTDPMAEALSSPWQLLVQGRAAEPSHLVGPFLLDASHGLLDGVSFDGVVWSMDESATIDPAASVLAYAGDTPLITEALLPGSARVWKLRIDPERSNLGRSADWPILLANAAEERRLALPGPDRTSLALGERFLWRGAPNEPLELVAPGGARRMIESTTSTDLITPRLDEPGLWELRRPRAGTGATAVLQTFGVSLLGAAESDLRDRSSVDPGPRNREDFGDALAQGGRTPWLESVLILLAAAMLGLDWWALRDRSGGGA